MHPLDEKKNTLRSLMRRQRRTLDPAWITTASERIIRHLVGMEEFQKAESVGCYMALPYEVQTEQLINTCREQGKRVCVPAFHEGNRRYEMTWLEPEHTLKAGRWNINEPDQPERADFMDVEMTVVPALAYDRCGGRLGHGGGHYDQMLNTWSSMKVGVAFHFQLFDRVPMGSRDIPVEQVITEEGLVDHAKAFSNHQQ